MRLGTPFGLAPLRSRLGGSNPPVPTRPGHASGQMLCVSGSDGTGSSRYCRKVLPPISFGGSSSAPLSRTGGQEGASTIYGRRFCSVVRLAYCYICERSVHLDSADERHCPVCSTLLIFKPEVLDEVQAP